MLRITIIGLCFFLIKPLFGQEQELCFEAGEQVRYDVYYNWQFVWLRTGQVTFKTKQIDREGQSYFHFDSQGGTSPEYSWIYFVDDRYQAYTEHNTLNPTWAIRDIHEGRNLFKNEHHFYYNDSTILSTMVEKGKQKTHDTLKFKQQTFDVLSAIYKCRTLNFSNSTMGDTIPISIVLDNELFNLYIRYRGKENISDKNEKTYETIKFSVLLVEGTIFSGGEDMTVWVSNDKNRIPIKVEAKILVGSIKAFLTDVKGQKHPSDAY